jgi:predicted enzyme related to lactoylglutathione lyase
MDPVVRFEPPAANRERLSGPTREIPGVGRFAALIDSEGAA